VKTHQQVVWRHWSFTKLASITFLSLAFSYWIDNLGFITEGRLAAVLIIPSLGVPNWSVIDIINTAPSVAAYLVHMLESRFVNLNPFMQQMFLKLHDIEDSEKKDFILETLRREFRDVVIEARKVFEHFNMLGSRVNVVTNKEEIKVPIRCKLVGLHEALEKNFDWIVPENPFDESSEPKSVHKGFSKNHLDTIQFIVEKTSAIDLNASFENT
jgi:hypothetical protein